MNDGSIQIAAERLDQALTRLDQGLSTLDARLEQYLAEPAPIDVALVKRHDTLKAEVAAVIAALDDMVGASSRLDTSEGILHHG